MNIEYERLEWEDYPSTETPINADNLNHLEEGIAGLYSDRYDMHSNIAYVEDGDTASKDYLPNSYLMRDGLFYKVKKTILYGDSFDSGEDGNIEHVDISSQFGSGDFATVEYTDTASKAYAVGDYLVYDNKFYLVSDNIAQDDTITPGVNVEQTTVGEEVSTLHTRFKPEVAMADCDTSTAFIGAYNSNTLNTPYKAGITTSSGGLVITYRPGSVPWNKQIAITDGLGELYKRYTAADGEWTSWRTLVPHFTTKQFFQSLTTPANDTANFTLNVGVSGYVPVAIAGFTSNHGSVLTQHLVLNSANNTVAIYVKSVSSGAITAPYMLTVFYVSSGFGI